MAYRPAQVYNGTGWDDIGDKRIGAANGDIPQASVANLTTDLAGKLDIAGGKVLQIVRATDNTNRSTTSTSFVDSGLSVTITPKKSTSALLLLFTGLVYPRANTGTNLSGYLQIANSANNGLPGTGQRVGAFLFNYTTEGYLFHAPLILGYDVAGSTSALTYKLRYRSADTSTTFILANDETFAQLYAIEVSA